MANSVIEASLKLSGTDAGASAMLKDVAANMKRLEEAASHSKEVQALGKQMAELKTQMEAVGQIKTAQANLAVMQERATTMAAATARLKTEMAGVAAPTASMTKAMEKAETASFKANAAMLKQVEGIERQRKALSEMGLAVNNAVQEEQRLARAFQDTARAAEITMRAEQHAAAASTRFAHASGGAAHARGGHGGGFDVGGAVAGIVAAHSYIGGMERVFETYREFDKESRYQRLVMGLTPDQQKPLVDQAVHGGATTRYNDIQWLETQREIAARGYGKDQVLAFSPIAARLGQAFDVTMPEAVKSLEGSLLGFHKDTSTMEKAMAAAERTADIQVKASKIGGLQFDDVTQLLKYGAAPARMAHLSEEQLYSFGVVGRKSNMGGEESGVAFRALVKNILSPTADAKTAMLAAGIDYSKYQSAPKAIDINAFGRDVAVKYGVRLNHDTRSELSRIFNDPKTLSDPARFAIAVTNALKETLGGNDAKSLKSIAKDAGKFRDDSVGGVDANGLLTAIMGAISKSPQLSNAIFGAKQGGRIYATLGDPELFKHILDEIKNQSQGFGKTVAEGRMEGFNGAVSKLQGSIMNLESAIGRAIDNNGEKGFFTITNATEQLAHFTQYLAEADPKILEFGTIVAGAGAMFGAVKLAGWFTGANALKGSAVALDSSALALKEAAGALDANRGGGLGTGGLPGEGGSGSSGSGSPGYASLFGRGALAGYNLYSLAQGMPEQLEKARTDNAPVDPSIAREADMGDSVRAWWKRTFHPSNTTSLPALVPPSVGAQSTPFSMLPADAIDRMKEHEDAIQEMGRQERESVFTLGQLDDAATKAATSLASLASSGSGSASGSGGSGGIISAAYHPGEGAAAALTPLLRGARHASLDGSNPYAGGVSAGDFVAPGAEATTAGMRQNNLGNLGWFRGMRAGVGGLLGPSNARDVDHSIARYATQEDGIRAAASLALHKYMGGRHNAWDVIAAKGGWTPGALGPGASVNVARAMGLSNRDDLHLDQPDQMVKFLHGLAVQEHGAAGRYFTDDRIRGALHREHPALAAPALRPRQEAAHATSAMIENAIRKVVARVEVDVKTRHEVKPGKGLKVEKTYEAKHYRHLGETIA